MRMHTGFVELLSMSCILGASAFQKKSYLVFCVCFCNVDGKNTKASLNRMLLTEPFRKHISFVEWEIECAPQYPSPTFTYSANS